MSPRSLATLVIAGVVLGALVVCVVFAPLWIIGDLAGLTAAERFKAQNDVRATLLTGFVGLLALGGAVLGASVTLRQVRANRDKHATDLYLKAIELLASEQLSVRQGGVYALEQLATLDGASEDYRGHVHALLTAFIRQRAPWAQNNHAPHGGVVDDIGAGLTVLARHRDVLPGSSELERVDLRGAELVGMDLTRFCFRHSNLSGANLAETTLDDASLRNADLSGADLRGANLSRADLTDADLDGVVTDDNTRWPKGFTPTR